MVKGDDNSASKHSTGRDKKPRSYISVIHEKDRDQRISLFEQQYATIHAMRYGENGQARNAPVDTLGTAEVVPSEQRDRSSKSFRFETLVGLMLSAQTKDAVTHKAVQNLRAAGLSPENLLSVQHTLGSTQRVEELIYPVSFYKRKAQYLKRVAQILVDRYSGDIPRTVQDLCALPGVGPKMAHLCMTHAWNETVGIGVDVHVHRISNRIEWVDNTKTPEDTRKALESYVPREKWKPINELLVGFGQTVCKPVAPRCEQCSLNTTCAWYAKHGGRYKKAKRLREDGASAASRNVDLDVDERLPQAETAAAAAAAVAAADTDDSDDLQFEDINGGSLSMTTPIEDLHVPDMSSSIYSTRSTSSADTMSSIDSASASSSSQHQRRRLLRKRTSTPNYKESSDD